MKISEALKLLYLCVFLLSSANAFTQEDNARRKITYTKLFKEIEAAQHGKSKDFTLNNVEIFFDEKIDVEYKQLMESFWTGKRSFEPIIRDLEITIPLNFTNCRFLDALKFKNCSFGKSVTFTDCIFQWVRFETCRSSNIRFSKSELKYGISFFNSHIYRLLLDDVQLNGLLAFNKSFSEVGIELKRCKSNRSCEVKNSILGYNVAGLYLIDCDFQSFILENVDFKFGRGGAVQYHPTDNDIKRPFVGIYNSNIKKCSFTKMNLNPPDSSLVITPTLSLSESNIESLFIEKSVCNGISFNSLNINKSIYIDSTEISHFAIVKLFDFPKENSLIPWKYFSGNKLGVPTTEGNVYQAKSIDGVADDLLYDELLSGYNKFFHMYKVRGNIISANSCYVEMKEIETKKAELNYKKDPTLKTWFDWRLNQFLKVFCLYGTSPVKALIISLYVIIAFAIFYFFFYSDWDRINRTFLIRQYRKMVKYFTSEQKLEDFYSEEYKEDFRSYEEFRNEIEEKKVEIPFFFNILGRPLYHLSLIKHRIMTWFYQRTEILSGRWTDLKPIRRIFVGSTVGLVIVFYLVYLGLVRALNSIVLSINTFSTLGFGDIPVKGISRYIAILEGFLGWFLLSIFSVSLISQILQN